MYHISIYPVLPLSPTLPLSSLFPIYFCSSPLFPTSLYYSLPSSSLFPTSLSPPLPCFLLLSLLLSLVITTSVSPSLLSSPLIPHFSLSPSLPSSRRFLPLCFSSLLFPVYHLLSVYFSVLISLFPTSSSPSLPSSPLFPPLLSSL